MKKGKKVKKKEIKKRKKNKGSNERKKAGPAIRRPLTIGSARIIL